MYEWQHQRRLVLGYTAQSVMWTCNAPQGVDLGEGGSLSYWCGHRTVVGLSCSYCEAHLKRTTNPLCGVLYKSLIIIIIIIWPPVMAGKE